MLAMWIPELPFQLACQREGSLRERPLAFLKPGGRVPSLWFVNRLARAEGIRPGLAMDQALRQAPSLRVLDPAPQIWWEAHAHLGEFLTQWSPQGQLGGLGEALVELQGTGRLFGPPQDAATRILKELTTRVGWMGHGGLSRSATAAQLAAHLERQLEPVAEGFEATFLAPHALNRLPDLQPRMQVRLRRLGLCRIGDLQPVPLPILCQFMTEPDARRVLAEARGEDRPRLPLLADPPGSSRHTLRLEPPRLAEEVLLAPWLLERLWNEGRAPRILQLTWWDLDGAHHRWAADQDALAQPPLMLARAVESAFRQLALRRIQIHRLELAMSWGLGRPRLLFEDPDTQRFEALEPALARLRHRYPAHPVLPGWVKAAEPSSPYRAR